MCFSAGNSQRPRSMDAHRAAITTYSVSREASQFITANPRFNARRWRRQLVSDIRPMGAPTSSGNGFHSITQPVGDRS